MSDPISKSIDLAVRWRPRCQQNPNRVSVAAGRGRESTVDELPAQKADLCILPGREDGLDCLHTAEVTGSIPVVGTHRNPW